MSSPVPISRWFSWLIEFLLFIFQYGTKALDKITKAILGHIENKVPPPKSYLGGDALFFRGMCTRSASLAHCLSRPALSKVFCLFLLCVRHETWYDGCGHLLQGASLWDQYWERYCHCYPLTLSEQLISCICLPFVDVRRRCCCCSFFPTDCSITKFLNRILGLEVHKQNHLFQYFTDNFDYLIEKDKKEGKYDMGILGKEGGVFFYTMARLSKSHTVGPKCQTWTKFQSNIDSYWKNNLATVTFSASTWKWNLQSLTLCNK